MSPAPAQGATVRTRVVSPFSDREFRALWLGRLISNVGDQFARVALSLIAFHETGIQTLAYELAQQQNGGNP